MLKPPAAIRGRFKTIYGALLIGIGLTLLSIFWLQNQQVIYQSELRGYDTMYYLRGGERIPLNIVVVGVDDASVDAVGGSRYPIPRTPMANAINFLHRAHAKVIGLDFTYKTPKLFGARQDRQLAQAIKRAGNVVLENVINTGSSSNYIQSEFSVTPPVAAFARGAASIGAANVAEDPDGVIRWTPLYLRGNGGASVGGAQIPNFGVALASVALHKSPAQVVRGLPEYMYISYVGQQRPGYPSDLTFPMYSFADVSIGDDPYKPFRDKIVLIIPDTILAGDLHETPVGQMFGGFVQANILNTILNRNPVLPAGSTTNNLILLIIGLLTAGLTARFGIGWSTLAAAVLAVGYFVVAAFLFSHFRTWIYVITPEITIVLIYAAVMAYRFATEERLKRKLKGNFSQYLTQEIVELFMNSPDPNAELAPAARDISVLFVDVRGFTSMSEKMQPADVVVALDIYLEELTASVESHGGMINKYVGDEIIGVWNALHLKPQPEHPMLAVKAALDMVDRMDGMNEQLRARGLPAIRYGIGINSGDAVVGQMGTRLRKQYDIIGDTVNTGARLCSAAGGGEIIIGQATWQSIGDRLTVEETDPLPLKGKSEPLRTFAVLGLRLEEETLPATIPSPATAR